MCEGQADRNSLQPAHPEASGGQYRGLNCPVEGHGSDDLCVIPALRLPLEGAGTEADDAIPPASSASLLPDWLPTRIRNRITVEDRGYEHGPCWIVSGWSNDKGHAKMRWKGVCTYVHRVVLAISLWVHPHELRIVDHLCRVRRCCNPDHLEDVTMKINTERGDGVHFQFRSAA